MELRSLRLHLPGRNTDARTFTPAAQWGFYLAKQTKQKWEKLRRCLGRNPDEEGEPSQTGRRVCVCSGRSEEVDYGRSEGGGLTGHLLSGPVLQVFQGSPEELRPSVLPGQVGRSSAAVFSCLERIPRRLPALCAVNSEFAHVIKPFVGSHVSRIQMKPSQFQDSHGGSVEIPGPTDPRFPGLVEPPRRHSSRMLLGTFPTLARGAGQVTELSGDAGQMSSLPT